MMMSRLRVVEYLIHKSISCLFLDTKCFRDSRTFWKSGDITKFRFMAVTRWCFVFLIELLRFLVMKRPNRHDLEILRLNNRLAALRNSLNDRRLWSEISEFHFFCRHGWVDHPTDNFPDVLDRYPKRPANLGALFPSQVLELGSTSLNDRLLYWSKFGLVTLRASSD